MIFINKLIKKYAESIINYYVPNTIFLKLQLKYDLY